MTIKQDKNCSLFNLKKKKKLKGNLNSPKL